MIEQVRFSNLTKNQKSHEKQFSKLLINEENLTE